MTWSYFHKLYEPESDLSTNFLVVAPNIIVLDRLRLDFEGARVFFDDPLLPDNGHEGQNWQDEFQLTVHIQDEIGHVGKQGNLFLSNIHRVFEGQTRTPSSDDEDTTDYFLGPKPVTKTTDSLVDLSQIVREVDDLVVLNDEAHHIHEKNAWFRAIEDIALKLRQKGCALSAQFGLSATPKRERRNLCRDGCRLPPGRGDPPGRCQELRSSRTTPRAPGSANGNHQSLSSAIGTICISAISNGRSLSTNYRGSARSP